MANSDEQSDAVDWRWKISDRPTENKTGPGRNSNFRRDFQREPFPSEIPMEIQMETHRILPLSVGFSVGRGAQISRPVLSAILNLGGGVFCSAFANCKERSWGSKREKGRRRKREKVRFEGFGCWKIERWVIFLLKFEIKIVKLIDIFCGLYFPSFALTSATATAAASAATTSNPLDFSRV